MTVAEELLIQACQERTIAVGEKVLVAGNRSGGIVAELIRKRAHVCAHVFDCHHARIMREHLWELDLSPSSIYCTSQVPYGPYTRAFFMTTPTSGMSAEWLLDYLEDIRSVMAVGGEIVFAIEGNPDDSLALLKKVYARVRVLPLPKIKITKQSGVKCVKGVAQVGLFRVVVSEKDAAAPRRDFMATWTASTPDVPECTFMSRPGCFCHRRADMGGLALAEVAISKVLGYISDGEYRILDMGCGCGFVGLLVAASMRHFWPKTNVRVTGVDSNVRALEMAEKNALALGFPNATYVLSDDGFNDEVRAREDVPVGQFLAVANPPYFGNWQIAELFLQTAHDQLIIDGRCLSVAKSEAGLRELHEKIFGNVIVYKRRGYFVFSSIRR